MKITKITQPAGMSDKAFTSMVKRNNMAVKSIEALRVGLERGKVK